VVSIVNLLNRVAGWIIWLFVAWLVMVIVVALVTTTSH
jgi:hypothetical protein